MLIRSTYVPHFWFFLKLIRVLWKYIDRPVSNKNNIGWSWLITTVVTVNTVHVDNAFFGTYMKWKNYVALALPAQVIFKNIILSKFADDDVDLSAEMFELRGWFADILSS